MITKQIKMVVTLLLVVALTACGEKDSVTSEVNETEKIKIYSTLFPIEDFTKKIGGDHVQVESILPTGSDAHTYEPTTQTMVAIAEADAFIYNGLGMESYAEDIAKSIQGKQVEMIEASAGIETVEHHEEHGEEEADAHSEHEHHHGDVDPHVWLDPIKSIEIAENIKEALIELKPDAKEDFEANFTTLQNNLENLDEQFSSLVDSKQHPEMIVSHAAYGYWEQRYHIEQIAIAGLSPSNEPTQKALEEIIHTAQEKDLTYVLFEQNVTPKVAKSLQKEIGAEALRLHNLSVLTEEDIAKDEDYFSLMYENISTLDKALN